MTKAQVIEVMGDPTSSHATDGVEYLTYKLTPGTTAGKGAGCAALGLITFGISYVNDDCTGGKPIDYYAQIKDGKLVGYGKVGDFGTTKNPTIDINKTITNKQTFTIVLENQDHLAGDDKSGKPDEWVRYVGGLFLLAIAASILDEVNYSSGWAVIFVLISIGLIVKATLMMKELAKILLYVAIGVIGVILVYTIFSGISLSTPLAIIIGALIIASAIQRQVNCIMDIPKDILEAYFCKWEQKHFDEFNKELIGRGLKPVTYERYSELLSKMVDDDEWMIQYQPPRIRQSIYLY